MKIALIAGTRPELIKVIPVYQALKSRADVTPQLVLTGQHREMAHEVLRMFGLTADVDMDVMQPGQTLTSLAGKLAPAIAQYLATTPPDILLVQGDTTSALMAGMLGFYSGTPVGHIEAGLRSGNLQSPFPEEFNRRALTLAARWHFAPTQTAADHLHSEGIHEHVHVVGNTVIDAALMMVGHDTPGIRQLQARFPFLGMGVRNTVLVTAHRRENFGAGIRNIATAIGALAAARPDLQFIIPAHPNPHAGPIFTRLLQGMPNIHITAPLAYDEILFLMQESLLILTDSGGIQEEAPTFDVPVLVLRNETERPEGIAAGCSILVGTDADAIQQHFIALLDDHAAYQRMCHAANPYGDGHASARIADILLQGA